VRARTTANARPRRQLAAPRAGRRRSAAALLARLPDDAARKDRLCELNVIEQVMHVARTTIVQDAWRRNQPLTLHAWIYRLQDGLVRDLGLEADGPESLEIEYEQAIASLASPVTA
jgi:carbonic anhydrase